MDISYPSKNFLDIKIGYACNFKCEYCYQVSGGKRQTGLLKKEHIASLLTYLDRIKLQFYVTLAGGEPFIYPHLYAISDALELFKNAIRKKKRVCRTSLPFLAS